SPPFRDFVEGVSERGAPARGAGDSKVDRVRELGHGLRNRVADRKPIDDALRALLAELRAPYREDGAIGPFDWYLVGLQVFEDLDLTTPDVADWCLQILLDEDHFRGHGDRAIAILARSELTLRQRAMAVQASDAWSDGEETHFDFFGSLGAVAIERAARWRSTAQAWSDLRIRNDRLRVSRPAAHDTEMIAAALDRGFVSDRVGALGLLSEHPGVESPALRSAVTSACDDCDDTVRAAARSLRAKRNW
ncbi:MAG: hypothetical protein ACRETX_16750, partial [Steroidobacteraceae bacterium]